jgi:hypothetical protein
MLPVDTVQVLGWLGLFRADEIARLRESGWV